MGRGVQQCSPRAKPQGAAPAALQGWGGWWEPLVRDALLQAAALGARKPYFLKLCTEIHRFRTIYILIQLFHVITVNR